MRRSRRLTEAGIAAAIMAAVSGAMTALGEALYWLAHKATSSGAGRMRGCATRVWAAGRRLGGRNPKSRPEPGLSVRLTS